MTKKILLLFILIVCSFESIIAGDCACYSCALDDCVKEGCSQSMCRGSLYCNGKTFTYADQNTPGACECSGKSVVSWNNIFFKTNGVSYVDYTKSSSFKTCTNFGSYKCQTYQYYELEKSQVDNYDDHISYTMINAKTSYATGGGTVYLGYCSDTHDYQQWYDTSCTQGWFRSQNDDDLYSYHCVDDYLERPPCDSSTDLLCNEYQSEPWTIQSASTEAEEGEFPDSADEIKELENELKELRDSILEQIKGYFDYSIIDGSHTLPSYSGEIVGMSFEMDFNDYREQLQIISYGVLFVATIFAMWVLFN